MGVLFFFACGICVMYCGLYAAYCASCGQGSYAASIAVLTVLSAAAMTVLAVVA